MTLRALKKLFRPPHKPILEAFAATLSAPVAVLDTQNQPLWVYPPHHATETTEERKQQAAEQDLILGDDASDPWSNRRADQSAQHRSPNNDPEIPRRIVHPDRHQVVRDGPVPSGC